MPKPCLLEGGSPLFSSCFLFSSSSGTAVPPLEKSQKFWEIIEKSVMSAVILCHAFMCCCLENDPKTLHPQLLANSQT